MPRVNISVTRTLTINTGNYESIKPSVTLTITDVDPENVGDVYIAVEDAITNLIKMEIMNCAGESKKVSEGLDVYCNNVYYNIEKICEGFESSMKTLNKF